jgi:hypothetical protein
MFPRKRQTRSLVGVRHHLTVPCPDLTWTCHVCGDERPDEKIHVYVRERVTTLGVRFRENVRYCADRRECIDGAPTVFFVPEQEL